MPQHRVTIADLAREAGVNKSAVSRALSGKPGVSEATRERVLAIAREHGWRPNATAQALSRARSGAIGWVVRRSPKSSTIDPFLMEQLIGVQMELSTTPYILVLKLVDTLDAELRLYAEWSAERRVDGVLLANVEVEDRRVSLLRELGMPSAVVASQATGSAADVHADACVSGRDDAGVDAILDHLLVTGHHRIGWVTGPEEFIATRRRLASLDRWRPRFRSLTISGASLAASAIAEQALRLRQESGVSAVVVDNELGALETVARLRAHGESVPADVSVVSWLSSDLCLLSDPTITALAHDVAGLGRLWTQALLAVTYPGTADAPVHSEPPVLQVRQSSAR